MEVIAFNTSDFKLTEFIGSKILHIYPISSSVGHDINMLKYDIKHAKEAYSNERGTENIDFEDMLSKLVMYRYMTLQIPIILGFDNGRSVIIDLTIDSKDPCSISDTTELPEKYRDVVYLYYYEEYTAPEIGRILGKKENTVYTLLKRARKTLKDKLGGDEYEA